MKLKAYNDYLFENEINVKELNLFLSPELEDIFKKMSSQIAKEILTIDVDSKFPFSYVDLSEEMDKVSFLPVNRLNRIAGITDNDLKNPEPESPVWGKYGRQTTGIGAFVTRVLPQYAGTKELEKFVHEFKGKLDAGNYTLKIVEGEELRAYYHVDTYYNPTPGVVEKPPDGQPDPRTVLMKSCLKQPEKQEFFDIYVTNPEKIKMLIMLNKKGQLVSRALVWYDVFVVDNPEKPTKGTLMDRIYYTSDSDVNIFIDYAKQNGWMYKTHQIKDCMTFVFEGRSIDKPISTKLPHCGQFKKYPYIDTLCYYTPESGRISNSRGKPARSPKTGEIMERLQLQKTNGGFKRLNSA